ncbi:MAG TPA: hypothetical protein VM140_12195 [Burkholderiales bacterium]|nr:hypothetical protein [Burkholderiales bacterium]
MSKIVCGMFDETVEADAALAELQHEGFSQAEVDNFYVSPPGQNAVQSVGGDAAHSSEGSRNAGRGAVIGAGIGLLVGAVIGAIVSLQMGSTALYMIAALGALIGAIGGSLSMLRAGRRGDATKEHPVERRGGRMIAVCVDRDGTDQRAVSVLRRHRARDLGRARGQWSNGWRDFDPRSPLATL